MKIMPRYLLPALLAVPIVLAGCGGSSKSSSSPSASAPASSGSSATPASSSGSGPYGGGSSSSAATAPPSASTPVLVSTKQAKLGTILDAGPKHLTVYLFEADTPGHSACSGQCQVVWPPVLGSAKAAGAAKAGLMGTIKLPDGKTQVTYKGHPIYYYIKDKDHADAYGQGIKNFGAPWYVLKPSGSKLDKS